MTYTVEKTYGHEKGLSCCFRQHKARTHCAKLHGYALAFTFTFAADQLDERNWVVNFGELKPLLAELTDTFDHKTVLAMDDPAAYSAPLSDYADIVILPAVGCEAFARHAWEVANRLIADGVITGGAGLRVVSCTVREHAGNAATYTAEALP